VSMLAERVTTADRDYIAGEAALTVADRATSTGDARLLLEALGLEGASCRWDVVRIALVVLERCRNQRLFSAETLHLYVPQRARRLMPPAVTWLLKDGLIEHAGHAGRSTSGHRRTALFRLTIDGERLSRYLEPPPGMIPGLETLNCNDNTERPRP